MDIQQENEEYTIYKDGIALVSFGTREQAEIFVEQEGAERALFYCDDCEELMGNGHDCDNCAFCGTD